MTSLELRTNVLAAYVSGGRAHEVPAVMEAMKIGAGDSFEVAFNTACAALAAGDLASARAQLEHAQRLGARCSYTPCVGIQQAKRGRCARFHPVILHAPDQCSTTGPVVSVLHACAARPCPCLAKAAQLPGTAAYLATMGVDSESNFDLGSACAWV